jgi:hypothetical protein
VSQIVPIRAMLATEMSWLIRRRRGDSMINDAPCTYRAIRLPNTGPLYCSPRPEQDTTTGRHDQRGVNQSRPSATFQRSESVDGVESLCSLRRNSIARFCGREVSGRACERVVGCW